MVGRALCCAWLEYQMEPSELKECVVLGQRRASPTPAQPKDVLLIYNLLGEAQ